MTMPSIREPELEEDEWDPQGLNAMSFAEEESDEDDEDLVEDEEGLDAIVEVVEDEENESEADTVGLGVDGLTELEQMEQSLLREESLDFAMIGEEE